jgi:hypothetical protein
MASIVALRTPAAEGGAEALFFSMLGEGAQ